MSDETQTPQTTSRVTAGNGGNGIRYRDTDPSRNVLDLVDAAIRRQDDLREQESKWRDKTDQMTAQHQRELRMAETQRIDAIRSVDVGNVQRAAEVQAGVAAALEGKVAVTAAAFESRLTATIEPIQKSIDDLRRAQYEQQGKSAQVIEGRASDADFAPILDELRKLTAAQNQQQGQKTQVTETQASSRNTGLWVGVALSGFGLLMAAGATIISLVASGP